MAFAGYAASLLFFVGCLTLGRLVCGHALLPWDAAGVRLRAQATQLALAFTATGRTPFLAPAVIVSVGIFAAARWPLWIPLAMLISQLITQGIAETLKRLYCRTRPDYWHVGKEAGHSFPSGHATTAAVYFGGWALVTALSALPVEIKAAIAAAFVLWAIAIDWSRLALGAHYVSDVIGGTLLGFAWLAFASMLVLQTITLYR